MQKTKKYNVMPKTKQKEHELKNSSQERVLSAEFKRIFYVDREYHEKHPVLYHRHSDFAEIIYVSEGHGSYRVDNRMYDLKPGNVIIVDQNIWHGEEPFLNEQNITYTCAMKFFENGSRLDALLKKNNRAVLEFEPGSAIEKLVTALYELQQKPDTGKYLCDCLSTCILNVVYDRLLKTQRQEEKSDNKNDELIRIITEYLDEHYMEPISLEMLGKKFGLSHYYLAHIFKKETGVSPMKYIMHRKIGEVQSKLMNTDMSISEIGEQLGFSSCCHLSAVFKKYFGISPKSFRQHFQESKVAVSDNDEDYYKFSPKGQ